MRGEPWAAQYLFLDLRGKYVDAANDHHVVGSAADLLHAAHGARPPRQETRKVSGAVADHGHCFFRQRRKDDLTSFTLREHPASVWIDDLGIEVILPNVRSVFGFDAFARHSRSDQFGQAVSIDGINIESALYLRAHRVGPRFCAAESDLE